MALFTPKITHSTLTFSPFTSESMLTIGSVVLNSSIIPRIQSATDFTDNPARALTPRYAQEKREGRRVSLGGSTKYRGLPVRDWTLRGRTLASLKVKSASENRVTLGPTSQESTMIVLTRNRFDHMWGMSPRDYEALYAVVRQVLLTTKAVRVVRGLRSVA